MTATCTNDSLLLVTFPDELRRLAQWVCWRKESREGKLTKVPVNPNTGSLASTTSPQTWTDFDTAVLAVQKFKSDGIGFVFSPDDPYCGIDLDHCRNLETGETADWA